MGKYINEKVFEVCVAGADMNRSYNWFEHVSRNFQSQETVRTPGLH